MKLFIDKNKKRVQSLTRPTQGGLVVHEPINCFENPKVVSWVDDADAPPSGGCRWHELDPCCVALHPCHELHPLLCSTFTPAAFSHWHGVTSVTMVDLGSAPA